jgi:regulator of protease activity HflC (stomatin/prohibitin superfamily)
MNIDQLLNLITILAWIAFAAFVLPSFVRSAMRGGLGPAIESLFSLPVLLLLLVVISISLLSASLVFIEPQEIGVVVSILAPRGVRDQPLRSGLRWVVPLAEAPVTYPIYWQTYTMSGKPLEGQEMGDDSIKARTSDGQEIAIDCSLIFRIDTEQVVRVHIDWQNRYLEDLVRPMARGLIRAEVSQFKVDEVNSSKRRDLEAELNRRLREALENKGLVMDTFLLRNITFSPEYGAAVEQKQVALQRATQREHEANQMRKLAAGEADRVRTRSEGESDAIVTLADAEAQARVIQAKAEAEALQLIADALADNTDLLTYQYINKLSPGIKAMLLPSDAPYILPLSDLGLLDEETPPEPSFPVTATGTLTETFWP